MVPCALTDRFFSFRATFSDLKFMARTALFILAHFLIDPPRPPSDHLRGTPPYDAGALS